MFFITVINCAGVHFSTITTQEPFKPLKGAKIVFALSTSDSERFHSNLTIRARTKARELGIQWVSGLDWNRPPF